MRIKISRLLTILYCLAIKQSFCQKFSKFNKSPYRVVKKLGKVNHKFQLLSDSLKIKVVNVNQLSWLIKVCE